MHARRRATHELAHGAASTQRAPRATPWSTPANSHSRYSLPTRCLLMERRLQHHCRSHNRESLEATRTVATRLPLPTNGYVKQLLAPEVDYCENTFKKASHRLCGNYCHLTRLRRNVLGGIRKCRRRDQVSSSISRCPRPHGQREMRSNFCRAALVGRRGRGLERRAGRVPGGQPNQR